jgi:chemotaxis protein CheC
MVGAIMSVPAVEFAEVSDKVIYIDDKFQVSDDEIRSNMILIPEMESLELLFSKLGVEI